MESVSPFYFDGWREGFCICLNAEYCTVVKCVEAVFCCLQSKFPLNGFICHDAMM